MIDATSADDWLASSSGWAPGLGQAIENLQVVGGGLELAGFVLRADRQKG